MSFSRLKYDKQKYENDTERSAKEGQYRIYGNYAENKNQCYSVNILGTTPNVSTVRDYNDLTFVNLAENESFLSNRYKNNKELKMQTYDRPDCNDKLNNMDTRFSHPVSKYRSTYSLERNLAPFLYNDPKNNYDNLRFKQGLNTRNFMRDNYKPAKNQRLGDGVLK